jgi:hypothetical protein
MDSCRKTVQSAQAGLSKAKPANLPKARQAIRQARDYMAVGDGWACLNTAHNAMRWEH